MRKSWLLNVRLFESLVSLAPSSPEKARPNLQQLFSQFGDWFSLCFCLSFIVCLLNYSNSVAKTKKSFPAGSASKKVKLFYFIFIFVSLKAARKRQKQQLSVFLLRFSLCLCYLVVFVQTCSYVCMCVIFSELLICIKLRSLIDFNTCCKHLPLKLKLVVKIEIVHKLRFHFHFY